MAQASLFPVNIISTVTPASVGVDGADLKWLALGDDGHTYAMKTLADHPALPLTEWVCYQLWQACGLAVPDCAALHQPHHPPAFGSRFEVTARQIPQNPAAFTVAGFFGPHLNTIGTLYPLDAFITNHDRHGRNMLIRQGVAGNALVSIDFSRAAMAAGAPFGNPHLLTPVCNTAQWWRYFRDHLAALANPRALQAAADLPRHWLADVIAQAPPQWSAGLDVTAVTNFWEESRTERARFAKIWL